MVPGVSREGVAVGPADRGVAQAGRQALSSRLLTGTAPLCRVLGVIRAEKVMCAASHEEWATLPYAKGRPGHDKHLKVYFSEKCLRSGVYRINVHTKIYFHLFK